MGEGRLGASTTSGLRGSSPRWPTKLDKIKNFCVEVQAGAVERGPGTDSQVVAQPSDSARTTTLPVTTAAQRAKALIPNLKWFDEQLCQLDTSMHLNSSGCRAPAEDEDAD